MEAEAAGRQSSEGDSMLLLGMKEEARPEIYPRTKILRSEASHSNRKRAQFPVAL